MVMANKLFESLVSSFFVEKKLRKGMVIGCYMSPVIHLNVTGTMDAGSCEYLSIIVSQAIAATLRSHKPKSLIGVLLL